MRLDEKARENVEAAERLLGGDSDGETWMMPLHNAAASRAYYAAYQAVADRAQAEGIQFDDREGRYYHHRTLPGTAVGWRILERDQADALLWLFELRVKADYEEDDVGLSEAARASRMARELVDSLLGDT